MASWENIKTKIGEVTGKVVAKTGEVADSASKHVRLKAIESNLSESYEVLGRLAYKHTKGKEVSEEKVNALIAEIDSLIIDKKNLKAEIAEDKARRAAERQAKREAKAAAKAAEAEGEKLSGTPTDEEIANNKKA